MHETRFVRMALAALACLAASVLIVALRWSRGVLFLLAVGCSCAAARPTFGATDSEACSENKENRRMDFWLGDWTVTYPGMPASAKSKVYLELDRCVIVETWDGGQGHKGENRFAYSSDDKSWHGMFADNQGRVHVFRGKVGQGVAEFVGPSVGPNGEAVLNRIRVVRVTGDKVEQSWEKSKDSGATWTMEFRGEYSRKKS
jgi:hypothetical protein